MKKGFTLPPYFRKTFCVGKAVDGFPHIRISTGQVDMVGSDVADYHKNTSLRTCSVRCKSGAAVPSGISREAEPT